LSWSLRGIIVATDAAPKMIPARIPNRSLSTTQSPFCASDEVGLAIAKVIRIEEA
jgi:hypothetical protein